MRVAVSLSVLLAVLGLVACQQEHSDNAAADLRRARALRSELASSSPNSSVHAIVSNLEVPAESDLSHARIGTTSDPAGTALRKPASAGARAVVNAARGNDTSRSALNAEPDPRIGTTRVPTPVISVSTITTPVAVASLPRDLPSPPPLPSPPFSSGAADGDEVGTRETGTATGETAPPRKPVEEEQARPAPQPPRIVIRGGDARPHDPCAIHRPRPASVMINNRIPMRLPGGVRLPR
jgi:hypothetical protein